MPIAPRHRLALFVVCLSVCDVAVVLGSQSGSQWLVSPELMKQAALKIVWQKALPIGDVETLEQLVVLDDRIYAFSDHNHVVSLDREDGNVIFSRPIAPAGFEVLGLGHYGDELFCVIGDELVELSAKFGRRLGTKSIGVGITCPAARNSFYYYLGAMDNRFRARILSNQDVLPRLRNNLHILSMDIYVF